MERRCANASCVPGAAVVLGFIGLFWHVNGRNKYDNYTFLKITPYNKRQLKTLMTFTDSEDIDIMKYSHGVNDTTDILVSPKKRKELVISAKKIGMDIQSVRHYGRYFDAEVGLIGKRDYYLPLKYNSHKAMVKHLKYVSKANKRYVKLQKLGKSYQGRDMYLIKISNNHKEKNPIVFIDAGHHAREWVALTLGMYIIDQLAIAAKQPCEHQELLGLDWYILPEVNPDGYEYSRSDPSNRMWRKSRSKTWRKDCFGVDLNRNYDFMWGYSGASFDPCNFQIYAGPKAFSERETKLVSRVMKKYSKRIKLYVSLHSYGHYLIYPYGYTGDVLPYGWEKLHALAQKCSEAIEKSGGPPLTIMSAGQWYAAAGASDDYAFSVVKIPYAYTLEMTNGYEFIVPEHLLESILPPYYEGLKAMAKEIRKEFVNLNKIKLKPLNCK